MAETKSTDANPCVNGPRVPILFKDYARENFRKVPRQACTGCWDDDGRWSDGVNVYCVGCARYQHGYDQAEEKMACGIIAAVVTAAFGLGASPKLIREAALDTLEAAQEGAADNAMGWMARMLSEARD